MGSHWIPGLKYDHERLTGGSESMPMLLTAFAGEDW